MTGSEIDDKNKPDENVSALFAEVFGIGIPPVDVLSEETLPSIEPNVPLVGEFLLKSAVATIEPETGVPLSDSLKAFIEQKYQAWSAALNDSLQGMRALYVEAGDSLEEFNAALALPILQKIDFHTPDAHTRAILQMGYANAWSGWEKTVQMDGPSILARSNFNREIVLASEAYQTASEHIGEVNASALASYHRFGFEVVGMLSKPSINSLATLFIAAAESGKEDKVYVKQRLIEAVRQRTDLSVMESNLGTMHPERGEDFYANSVEHVRSEYAALAARRAALISQGDIYIKPDGGARSYGVQRLSYDQESETLTIRTKTPLASILLPSQSEALRSFLGGDMSRVESIVELDSGQWSIALPDGLEVLTAVDPTTPGFVPEPIYQYLNLRGYSNPAVARVLVEGNLSGIEESKPLPVAPGEPAAWTLTLTNGTVLRTTQDPASEDFSPTVDNTEILSERSEELNCTCVVFLDGLHIQSSGPDTYEVNVPRERLEDFFTGLELASVSANHTTTYAESAIPVTLLNGNTWEIRQVNQAMNIDRLLADEGNLLETAAKVQAEYVTDYVKMSGNAVIASISLGDTGRETSEVLSEVLLQIDPAITPEEIEALSDRLKEQRTQAARKIQVALSDYLTERKNDLIPDYPIERISVDSMSTDFMVVASVEPETGKVLDLSPVLVDLNFHYGTTGLKQADFIDYMVSQANQTRLRSLVKSVLDAV